MEYVFSRFFLIFELLCFSELTGPSERESSDAHAYYILMYVLIHNNAYKVIRLLRCIIYSYPPKSMTLRKPTFPTTWSRLTDYLANSESKTLKISTTHIYKLLPSV